MIICFCFLILLEQSFLTFINIKFYKKVSNEGFEQKLGNQYKYIDALKNNTPSDSTIINPPQTSLWPSIGNQPILRYFLYPRKLISGSIVSTDDFAKDNIDKAYFVFIDDSGEKTFWPSINKVEKQIIFNESDLVNYFSIEEIITEENIKIYKIIF